MGGWRTGASEVQMGYTFTLPKGGIGLAVPRLLMELDSVSGIAKKGKKNIGSWLINVKGEGAPEENNVSTKRRSIRKKELKGNFQKAPATGKTRAPREWHDVP